jgi:hypothetical protein
VEGTQELENSVLRIFEPKRVEVMEGWTKLDNVELHTSYPSPDIIRKNKWAGHVAHMERWQICIDVVGGRKGRSPLVKPRCRREVILKWILGKLGLEYGFYSLGCSRDGCGLS